MSIPQPDDNSERPYDEIIDLIVNYVYDYEVVSKPALARSKLALIDSLGVAIESLARSKECTALVKPILEGATSVPGGFRLPGTSYSLDLLQGAFNMGAMIRYLDHNDAFAGAEWGHPSDNLGAILATADVLTREALAKGNKDGIITIKTVLISLIKAYEIQGVFQIRNAFNRVGLDHTILVKVGSTAVVSWMMGLDRAQRGPAQGLGRGRRLHARRPPRRVGAGGTAGHPHPLTAARWGFYEVLNKNQGFQLPQPFGTWVVENVIFKVLTAEGHGLTAVEAAMTASKELQKRNLDPLVDIKSIRVRVQEAAMIIINKRGSLNNAADRDHCLRYMLAVVLLKNGVEVETEDYQDDSPWATDARVEKLRSLISMEEDPQMTRDYHNPEIRSVGSAIEIFLKDGSTVKTWQDFPLGHPARGDETDPMVRQKAVRNLGLMFSKEEVDRIMNTFDKPDFESMPTSEYIDLFSK
ncbi:2-methylcitrate dehydratase [Apiospora arundinis]